MTKVINFVCKKTHLIIFKVTQVSFRKLRTSRVCSICWRGTREKITMFSRWTSANCHLMEDSITSMSHWNVAEVFFKSNGRRVN